MNKEINTQMTQKNQIEKAHLSRRNFIKSTAFVGGSAVLGLQAAKSIGGLFGKEASAAMQQAAPYILSEPQNLLYSSCLQCHVACQIKAKIWDGTLAKLSGNPYSPQNLLPHIPYDTKPKEAATIDGKLCGKGQTAIQTLQKLDELPGCFFVVAQGAHRPGGAGCAGGPDAAAVIEFDAEIGGLTRIQ